jgi:hypothetical protein
MMALMGVCSLWPFLKGFYVILDVIFLLPFMKDMEQAISEGMDVGLEL